MAQEAARVYAEALFDVAKEKGKLDAIGEELGQFADAVAAERDLQVFLFSPYFSSAGEDRGAAPGGLRRRPGARELPRAAGREAPDAGDLPHPAPLRRALEAGEQAPRRDRDERGRARPGGRRRGRRAEVERQTGQKVELASRVDDEILGGIVLQVGNMVLDASIRSRLEKLRKSVAQAA